MPSPFELNETIGNKSHVCSKPGIHHSPSPLQRAARDKSPQAQPHESRKTTKTTQTFLMLLDFFFLNCVNAETQPARLHF